MDAILNQINPVRTSRN